MRISIVLAALAVATPAYAQSWVDPFMTPHFPGWTVAEVVDYLENDAQVPPSACARVCSVQDNVIDHSVFPPAVDLPAVSASSSLNGGAYVSASELQMQMAPPVYATAAVRLKLELEAVNGPLVVGTQYPCLQTPTFSEEVAGIFADFGQGDYASYAQYGLVEADVNGSVCYVQFDTITPIATFSGRFKINVKANAAELYADEVVDGCPATVSNVFSSYHKQAYLTTWSRTSGVPRNTTYKCDVACRDAAPSTSVVDIDCGEGIILTWPEGSGHRFLGSNMKATEVPLTYEQCAQASTPAWMQSDWEAVMNVGYDHIGKRFPPFVSTPDTTGNCSEQACGVHCSYVWRP